MKNQKFDPNAAAIEGTGIFGLPYLYSDSKIIFLPVPWEVTTSYGAGTSQGPNAIIDASYQVDLYDLEVLRPYEAGLFVINPDSKKIKKIELLNRKTKKLAQTIIREQTSKQKKLSRTQYSATLKKILKASQTCNDFVHDETLQILRDSKIPAILGGDHSVPLGAFHAAAKHFGDFGILHFDAHSDTRLAYEGFQYSHASIMYNALEEIPKIKKLVQVGIRDFCEQEIEYCKSQGSRVEVFFDRKLKDELYQGKTWLSLCKKIISNLPKKVWISFDIDGLDPTLCPNTGTPVAGGLQFQEACAILSELAKSGRTIIGFDLNEVSPDLQNKQSQWDANVGARLLYKMTALTLASQKICAFL